VTSPQTPALSLGQLKLGQLKTLSLLEGIPSSVFGAWTTGAVLTGYALYLGAGPLELGFISSTPLLGQVMSPLLIRLSERGKTRRVWLLVYGTLSRGAWLGVVLLPLLSQELRLPLLISLSALSWTFTAGVSTLLTALLGDLIPRTSLGRFFGLRNALLGAVSTLVTVAGGAYLDHTAAPSSFRTLLLIAALVGLGAVTLLGRYPEPSLSVPGGVSSRSEGSPFHDPAFRVLVMYAGYWFFAASLSAPFVLPYFLEGLKMTYAQVSLWSAGVAGCSLLFGPLWGRLADRVGNKPILYLVTLLASSLLPLSLLLATPSSLGWVWLSAVLEALVTSALGFGLLGLILSTSPPQRRSRYLASFSALTGLSGFVGSTLAGPLFLLFTALLPRLGEVSSGWTPYQALLLCSALLRLPTVLLLRRVKEEGAWSLRSLFSSL